jgi:hypothetical protein
LQFYSDFALAGTQFWPTCKDIFNEESNVRYIVSMFPIHAAIIQVFYYLTLISFGFIIVWILGSMKAICKKESDLTRWHPLLLFIKYIFDAGEFIRDTCSVICPRQEDNNSSLLAIFIYILCVIFIYYPIALISWLAFFSLAMTLNAIPICLFFAAPLNGILMTVFQLQFLFTFSE